MPESNKFTLLELQDQDKIDYTRSHCSQTWKGILSSKDFILREYVLSNSEMGRPYAAFMLINVANERLCSCEVVFREGHRIENGNGKTSTTAAKVASVGAVFTYTEHRRKGYAKIMLNKVIEKLHDMNIDFSILHSEVGEYYSNFDYVSFHVPVLQKSVTHKPQTLKDIRDEYKFNNETLKLVSYHEFKPLIDIYNKYTTERIESYNDNKTRVTIDINEHIVDWFHLRSKYVHYQAFNEEKPDIDFSDPKHTVEVFKNLKPEKFGMTLEIDGQFVGYVIWTYDWVESHNYVTVLSLFTIPGYEDQKAKMITYLEDYLSLLNSQTAQKFTQLKVWGSEISNEMFKGEEIVNSSLSAIRMFNEEDQKKLISGELVWENNNKLSWY
ncbi:hypothetical protein CLIB1444_03S09340 [[Candida] jaroonii]|uniref:Uncharacterized protein n=1 Tax=[Candida] jaroonii TaxID=467808 RepID=A0ACA9Y7D0_9ASCO|nr:hypothetical protein CLIB1444_03S09340 [[Candida] jaroonii]